VKDEIPMISRHAVHAAAALFALMSVPAGAQMSKTIPGETRVVSATVEAIERSTRQVTVKTEKGTYEVLYAPDGIKRFDTLKVGDRISATYYENIVLRLKAPGTPDADHRSVAAVPSADKNAGTVSHQRTITATITEIDPKVPSITFTGPHNWTYTSRVEDKAALAKVKVGDKVDITWTEAMILSLDDGKKK
jgi:hypothetical protein